jgi:hypothetical protein
MEQCHFVAVCGFFELSGSLVSHGLIDQLNSERLSWKEKRNTKRKMTPIRR